MSPWLAPLRETLDRAPAPTDFFFRDDDAGWEDDALRALVRVFERHGVPLDIAAIPAALRPALADELVELAAEGKVAVHQHGLAHRNHERSGRKCEFGPSRSLEEQRRDIASGRERMVELLGEAVEPIFTPPWNRCTEATAACLAELGFRALSRESRAEPLLRGDLPELAIHVDWLARGKHTRLSRAEVGLLLAEHAATPGAVGVMLHHAVLVEDDFDALEELLVLVSSHEQARCRPMLAALSQADRVLGRMS